MFALCVLAVFCLATPSRSAPLACEELVRPLDRLDPDHLAGSWVMVAGSLSDPAAVERFKSRDSAVIHFANASDSKISFKCDFAYGSSCQYLHSNISLEGSSFALGEMNLTVTFLFTSCPDCVAMRFNRQPDTVRQLFLLSRRRAVDQRELEELKAQSQCLNLTPPVLMDPTKELCPEQVSDGTPEGH